MFRDELITLRQEYKNEEFALALQLLEEAYNAYMKGNFGISSIIYSDDEIIAHGQNRMVFPTFSSALHAEMDAINTLEHENTKLDKVSGLVLYSSLEPCPMCMTRIINSGITKIYYMADDKEGGAKQYLKFMPPIWQKLGAKLEIQKMQLPSHFEELSIKLAFANADKIHKTILKRQ